MRLPSSAVGKPLCTSTAPRTAPQASQMASKGLLRSGKTRIGAVVRVFVTPLNAALQPVDHTKLFASASQKLQKSRQCSPAWNELYMYSLQGVVRPQLCSSCGDRPVLHNDNLLGVHVQALSSLNMAQQLQLRSPENAIGQFCKQRMLPQHLKHHFVMLNMLLSTSAVHDYLTQIHQYRRANDLLHGIANHHV